MKKLLQTILRWIAKSILRKYRPKIIAITGSVGKTSAKEAIYLVLKDNFRVRKSEGNYNTEIGVPLTIIGAESGKSSLWRWFLVIFKGLRRRMSAQPYPEILILEYGADRPGDIKYLAENFPPDIGVVTAIGKTPVHLQYYRNRDQLVAEKSLLVKFTSPAGAVVLNSDDEDVSKMSALAKGKCVRFGLENQAEIQAVGINLKTEDNGDWGLHFKISAGGTSVPLFIPGLLAEHMLYPALASAACGIELGMNFVDIAQKLAAFRPPRGRLNYLAGVKGSNILDDTYNSSPAAAMRALELMEKLPARRRIAVLGDMLELGGASENAHREIGREIARCKADVLVTVGKMAKFMAEDAAASGMDKQQIFSFEKSGDAVTLVKNLIESGDLVLVKGSQGVRMEKIVKEILADPNKAEDLLVRQSREWLSR
ncbi:UDP-N-acetylmuramoyl-tripeptide--D-alanyl-D-alanine ligase [bacterium]|nr:MAG: UDP-N-acetylmuramoyl-tripeptide--D-alanyl-D-alanine ligase [bacterium]